MPRPSTEPGRKNLYVGPPAFFQLHQACHLILESFDAAGCYLVGSATNRPDYRDVDVRLIMEDEAFDKLFPCASEASADSCMNPRWNLICTAITVWLREQTRLPIDFQIQKMSHANQRYPDGARHPLGNYFAMEPKT